MRVGKDVWRVKKNSSAPNYKKQKGKLAEAVQSESDWSRRIASIVSVQMEPRIVFLKPKSIENLQHQKGASSVYLNANQNEHANKEGKQ